MPQRLQGLLTPMRRGERDQRLEQVRVVRGVYDVPYLAGYSADGKTVYVDRRLPARIRVQGRRGEEAVDPVPFLLVHEVTEKLLMQEAGSPYEDAHRVATAEERKRVEGTGLAWDDYEHVLDGYIRETKAETLKQVPPDLDLLPYMQLGDVKHLAELQRAQWGAHASG